MRNLAALTILIVIPLEATAWLCCLRQCGHFPTVSRMPGNRELDLPPWDRRFYAWKRETVAGDLENSFSFHHLELTSNCSLPESSLRSSTSLTPTSDSALFFSLLNNLQSKITIRAQQDFLGGGAMWFGGDQGSYIMVQERLRWAARCRKVIQGLWRHLPGIPMSSCGHDSRKSGAPKCKGPILRKPNPKVNGGKWIKEESKSPKRFPRKTSFWGFF